MNDSTKLDNKESTKGTTKNKTPKLHPENKHNSGYDFDLLNKASPELRQHVFVNNYGNSTINFSDSLAVKALNKALLQTYYRIDHWDIPDGYLCPPIPGRADYIHYLYDLFRSTHQAQSIEKLQSKVNILDIGTGASCIYPIIGQRCYQWRFIASDIDPVSISVAKQIIESNKGLSSYIDCRLQDNANHFFKNILKSNEYIDLTLCNPPFHETLTHAQSGTNRKWKNLGKEPKSTLNFGGQKAELWCEGGELAFITKMIIESKQFKTNVLWFTSLVSKSNHINPLKKVLAQAKVAEIRVIDMRQGHKISRFLAWTFQNANQQLQWFKELHKC